MVHTQPEIEDPIIVTAAPVAVADQGLEASFTPWERTLAKLMARFWFAAHLLWATVLILWAATLPVAYMAWWVGFPAVWTWADGNVARGLAALVASVFLFAIPIWVGMAARKVTGHVAKVSISPESVDVQVARNRVEETEKDALNRLESSDEAHLLPLLRYSRAQLDAYYAIGLHQTRRGFFNAVVAMWLGFLILIFGVALYVGPVERFGLRRPSEDFNTLVLGSAAIVEFISALFLWVYRSTINQLTFYYRLQMRSHTAILCYRMTTTMTDGDGAKRAIIDSTLDSSLAPERIAPTGSGGLSALIRGPRP